MRSKGFDVHRIDCARVRSAERTGLLSQLAIRERLTNATHTDADTEPEGDHQPHCQVRWRRDQGSLRSMSGPSMSRLTRRTAGIRGATAWRPGNHRAMSVSSDSVDVESKSDVGNIAGGKQWPNSQEKQEQQARGSHVRRPNSYRTRIQHQPRKALPGRPYARRPRKRRPRRRRPRNGARSGTGPPVAAGGTGGV